METVWSTQTVNGKEQRQASVCLAILPCGKHPTATIRVQAQENAILAGTMGLGSGLRAKRKRK